MKVELRHVIVALSVIGPLVTYSYLKQHYEVKTSNLREGSKVLKEIHLMQRPHGHIVTENLLSSKPRTNSKSPDGHKAVNSMVSEDITVCEPTERVNHIRTTCQNLQLDKLKKYYKHNVLFVNEKYKYVACLPPKAGCTSWKIILANNTQDISLPSTFKSRRIHKKFGKSFGKYGFHKLSRYNTTRKNEILRDYFKFMVVRHPLDRLLSGYIDKIVVNNFRGLKGKITKIFGDASLSSFLKYCLKSSNRLNQHFAPVTYVCDPCNVRYDKIIKLETNDIDLEDVIKRLGLYGRIRDVHANSKRDGAGKMLISRDLSEYRNVSDAILTDVLDVIGFKYDLSLFGYSWKRATPNSGLLAKCSDDKLKCC